jgi:Leucine-rich repeat (LRR) protein
MTSRISNNLFNSRFIMICNLIAIFMMFLIVHNCCSAEKSLQSKTIIANRTQALERLKEIVPDQYIYISNESLVLSIKIYNASKDIGDEILELCKWFPELNQLILECSNLSESRIMNLKYMHSLTYLAIGPMSDKNMIYIKDLINLIELNLAKTDITDAGLENIKGLNKLKKLYLYGTKITDNGLKYLAGLKNLEQLEIQHNNISDKGIVRLSGLSKLRYLSITKTKVTLDGLLSITGLDSIDTIALTLPNELQAPSPDRLDKVKKEEDKIREFFPSFRHIEEGDIRYRSIILRGSIIQPPEKP